MTELLISVILKDQRTIVRRAHQPNYIRDFDLSLHLYSIEFPSMELEEEDGCLSNRLSACSDHLN